MYRNLETSAASLYDGDPPLLLTGTDHPEFTVGAGDEIAVWELGVLLRYAPDDRARENALIAIGKAPLVFDPWASPGTGWYWVLVSLQLSGRAHLYQSAFTRQLAARHMLQVLWIDTATRDDKVRRALDLPTSGHPSPYWRLAGGSPQH